MSEIKFILTLDVERFQAILEGVRVASEALLTLDAALNQSDNLRRITDALEHGGSLIDAPGAQGSAV